MSCGRETPKQKASVHLETTVESGCCSVCPWDEPDSALSSAKVVASPPASAKAATTVVTGAVIDSAEPQVNPALSICPWEQDATSGEPLDAKAIKSNSRRPTSITSDITEINDRMQRNMGIRHQNTVDSGETGMERLNPNFSQQRRSSVSCTLSRLSDYQFGRPSATSARIVTTSLAATITTTSTMPSPTVGQSRSSNTFQQIRSQNQNAMNANFQLPTLFYKITDAKASQVSITSISSDKNNATDTIGTDPPLPLASISKIDVEDEVCKLQLDDRQCTTQLTLGLPKETTPPPFTKIRPPSNESNADATTADVNIATLCNLFAEDVSKSVKRNQGESTKAEMLPSQEQINLGEAIMEVNPNEYTAEVLPLVKEVQIELIDTLEYVENKCNQNLKLQKLEVVATMTPINLHESQEKETMQQLKQLSDTEASTTVPTGFGFMLDETKSAEAAELQIPEDVDGYTLAPEELSPTTDEYQEGLQFGVDDRGAYDYDIADPDTQIGDYTPPTPTPAPSLAPLAELDVDTVDDELEEDFGVDGGTAAASISSPTVVGAGTFVSVRAGTGAVMYTEVKCVYEGATQSNVDESRRRRKKRNLESKKLNLLDKDKEKKGTETEKNNEKDHERATSSCATGVASTEDSTNRNTVCPWEDENVTTSDDTFVKTYSTLGYL